MCFRHVVLEVLDSLGMVLVRIYFGTESINVICVSVLTCGCLVLKFGLHLLVKVTFNVIRTVPLGKNVCSVGALF
jgi:hypothetical protein